MRKLLAVAVVLSLTACASWWQQRTAPLVSKTLSVYQAGGLPIMQGVTTTHQTQVLVLGEKGKHYVFSLLDQAGNKTPPTTIARSSRQGFTQEIQRVVFQGLLPNSAYRLRVRAATGEVLDERELRTLDPRRQAVRFVFGSCMADYFPQADIWQQMVALRPDVIFLIGDNAYAKAAQRSVTPDFLWRRYAATRSSIALFRNRKLVPVVAVWDDNDYGMNDGDRSYDHKQEALSVFKAFFCQWHKQ